MTLTQIREDLKEIRYYYSRREKLDKAFKDVGPNSIMEKVAKYSEAISTAALKIYDLYTMLYKENYTQEALAAELGYTPEYIQMLNKKLLLFLQGRLDNLG